MGEHVMIKWESLVNHGVHDKVGDRSEIVRLDVEVAFGAMVGRRLEPVLSVEVLSLRKLHVRKASY